MSKNKCIIILSEKSSGSSACQYLLAELADINLVSKTRHFENETLYWTKAASMLHMPQLDMLDSVVPIESTKAREDLIAILKDNLDYYEPPNDDKEIIINGWKLLCEKYSPIFLEKSPHHLFQWSALELIIDCIRALNDVDFLLIGLIRNPVDTFYSQFKRWKTRPENLQYQWLIAYQNLLMLKEVIGDNLVIIRYEDMVSSLKYMERVFNFCDVSIDAANQNYLHQMSILNWKTDKSFGFSLSNEVIELAQYFGYEQDDLINKSNIWWPFVRELSRAIHKIKMPIKKFARNGVRDIKSIIET